MQNVRKIYEVSTAHIPAEIASAIDDGIFARRPAMVREEGWLFSVPEDLTQPPGLNSKAFDCILALAQDAGCDWVLFDRDVPPVEYLHTFDW
jgi:hypothetical protein